MARHSFIQMSKLSNVKGRISYMVDVLSDLFSFLPEFSGHAGKPLRHIDQQIEHIAFINDVFQCGQVSDVSSTI